MHVLAPLQNHFKTRHCNPSKPRLEKLPRLFPQQEHFVRFHLVDVDVDPMSSTFAATLTSCQSNQLQSSRLLNKYTQ